MSPDDRPPTLQMPFLLTEDEIAPEPTEPVDDAPPVEFPTVAMAEVYLAQGLTGPAREVLERILEREPHHGEAARLMKRLEGAEPGRASVEIVPGNAGDASVAWRLPRNVPADSEPFVLLVSFVPEEGEVRRVERFVPIVGESGIMGLDPLDAPAIHCAAIGWRVAGDFVVVAHSEALFGRVVR